MALKNWLDNSGRVVLEPWLHKGLVFMAFLFDTYGKFVG